MCNFSDKRLPAPKHWRSQLFNHSVYRYFRFRIDFLFVSIRGNNINCESCSVCVISIELLSLCHLQLYVVVAVVVVAVFVLNFLLSVHFVLLFSFSFSLSLVLQVTWFIFDCYHQFTDMPIYVDILINA